MVLDFTPKDKEVSKEEETLRRSTCASCTVSEDGVCLICDCEIEKLVKYADAICQLEHW